MNSLPCLIEGIRKVATLRKRLDAVLILLSWGRCTYPSMGLDSDLRVWGWATRRDRWLQAVPTFGISAKKGDYPQSHSIEGLGVQVLGVLPRILDPHTSRPSFFLRPATWPVALTL
jgi:hypothetical protein